MARPLRIQYPGAFYHIMCRGNKGGNIFADDDDRKRFLFLLAESLGIYEVTLYAYVLMHNHFHLILQTGRSNLSEFMRRFNICYTGWFNYHHATYGHLYQGRYKSILIDADSYLLTLSRYVHLNPLRLKTTSSIDHQSSWHSLQRYQWSTLHGYIKQGRVLHFVNYDLILNMIGGRKQYHSFMIDGIKKGYANPLNDAKYQMILGNDNFVQKVKQKHSAGGSNREQPMHRRFDKCVIKPSIIIDCVSRHFGLSPKELLDRYYNGIARGITSELLYRFCALKLREIGELLNIDYSSVYKSRYRLKTQLSTNQKIARIYRRIESEITNKMSNV
jgi:putative transposase